MLIRNALSLIGASISVFTLVAVVVAQGRRGYSGMIGGKQVIYGGLWKSCTENECSSIKFDRTHHSKYESTTKTARAFFMVDFLFCFLSIVMFTFGYMPQSDHFRDQFVMILRVVSILHFVLVLVACSSATSAFQEVPIPQKEGQKELGEIIIGWNLYFGWVGCLTAAVGLILSMLPVFSSSH